MEELKQEVEALFDGSFLTFKRNKTTARMGPLTLSPPCSVATCQPCCSNSRGREIVP